jgi:hypothetical protein
MGREIESRQGVGWLLYSEKMYKYLKWNIPKYIPSGYLIKFLQVKTFVQRQKLTLKNRLIVEQKLSMHKCMRARLYQGCQIYLDAIDQNGGKCTKLSLKYKIVIIFSKWPYYIPNAYIIYQPFPFQDRSKFTQIGIFGSKYIPSGNLWTLCSLVERGSSP